jgi:hypothetical protein
MAWATWTLPGSVRDDRRPVVVKVRGEENMKYVRRVATNLILSIMLLICYGASPVALTDTVITASASPAPREGIERTTELVPATIAVEPVTAAPSIGDDSLLAHLAEATWSYLSSDWATDNHLPWSWRMEASSEGSYANTAEIGFYALSWLAAYDYQQAWSPSWAETEAEVSAVLDQLRAWQTGSQQPQPNGPNAYQNSVFYQWYWISWDPPVVGAGDANHVVPSIDNAWLAACLITIREYASASGYSTLAQQADDILGDMNFLLWYHADTHLFSWGANEDPQGGGPADTYSNENRIINFVARALGQLSAEEFRLSLEALIQSAKAYGSITVEKVAWDGSYFTYTSPALFIREVDTSYGPGTIVPATEAQIAYAQDQGYEAWGLSDCFDVGAGGYVQQGAPPADKPPPLEDRPGLVTPHASALALITPLAPEAISNLQIISDTYECAFDAAYGFRDSVMVNPPAPDYGQCSDRFSALGQEWLFLALMNYETGFIWEYFYQDPGVLVAHIEMYGEHQVYLPIILRSSASLAPVQAGTPGERAEFTEAGGGP